MRLAEILEHQSTWKHPENTHICRKNRNKSQKKLFLILQTFSVIAPSLSTYSKTHKTILCVLLPHLLFSQITKIGFVKITNDLHIVKSASWLSYPHTWHSWWLLSCDTILLSSKTPFSIFLTLLVVFFFFFSIFHWLLLLFLNANML